MTTTTTTIYLRTTAQALLDGVSALADIASRDASCEHLHGICIVDGRMVATDGRLLMYADLAIDSGCTDDATVDDAPEAMIPLPEVKRLIALIKATPKRQRESDQASVTLAITDDTARTHRASQITISYLDTEHTVQCDADARFPPYEKAIPETRDDGGTTPVAIHVDPSYLARAATAMRKVYGLGARQAGESLRMQLGEDDLSPVRLDMTVPRRDMDYRRVVGVVMPRRG